MVKEVICVAPVFVAVLRTVLLWFVEDFETKQISLLGIFTSPVPLII